MLFCPAYSQVAIKGTQHVVFESSAKLRCVQDPCEFALSLHPCLQGRVSKEPNGTAYLPHAVTLSLYQLKHIQNSKIVNGYKSSKRRTRMY